MLKALSSLPKLFVRLALLSALTMAVFAPFESKASSIVGNFSIAGSDTFDSTQITFLNPALLLSSTLPGIHGFSDNGSIVPVTMTSFAYANAVGTQLFTFTQNGVSVGFIIYQDSINYTPFAAATPTTLEENASLKVQGYGYLMETGYDTTSAAFSLTTSQTGAISFQVVGNSPAYPSGGPGVAPEPSSLLLLGTSMLGVVALMKRRFA